ncbi:MAG: hypothetical protein KIH62_002490 [Candidatus Kerfeldbacteria bacterium]|nr:hypothetical protein [Candidatus Kerfeldbacteria bacterium]
MKFNWSAVLLGFSRLRFGIRWPQIIVIITIALVAAQACALYFGLPKNQTTIFLHYTVYFGIDRTGSLWDAAWIPCIGLGIVALNTTLAYATHLYRMRMTVLMLTACCELLLFIESILLVIINQSV